MHRMAKGRFTGGRKPGSVNKTTALAKDVIAFAADGLGGGPGLLKWAQSDPKNAAVFWGTIYPKLVPHQITGESGGPMVFEVIRFAPPTAK